MREKTNVPGVYAIKNLVSGRAYIGRAVNMSRRWGHHLYNLKNGTHRNPFLQRAWDRYGPDAFQFAIWENLSGVPEEDLPQRLHEAEAAALAAHPRNYNIAELLLEGVRQSARTKALIGAASKQMWATQSKEALATRAQKLREATNAKLANPEWKAWRFGLHRLTIADPAYRQALSNGVAAAWSKPDVYARKVAALRAASSTAEVKARRGAGQEKRWAGPEQYAKQVALIGRIAASSEIRAVRSRKTAAYWADPERAAARRAALKKAGADPALKAKRLANLAAGRARKAAQISPVAPDLFKPEVEPND